MELNPVSAREQRKLDQKKTGRAHASSGPTFDAVVQETFETESNQAIDSLMNDLREQERRFVDLQTQVELDKYRKLLQRVLKMLSDGNYKSESLRRPRKGNIQREPYLIIRKINEKVDELARALVSRDNKAFALMRTLEEIRGLILDLRN